MMIVFVPFAGLTSYTAKISPVRVIGRILSVGEIGGSFRFGCHEWNVCKEPIVVIFWERSILNGNTTELSIVSRREQFVLDFKHYVESNSQKCSLWVDDDRCVIVSH